MFYPRKILARLEQEINRNEMTVLTGMRQVGKTTLLKRLYDMVPVDNKAFFDFEKTMDAKLFEDDDFDAILDHLAERGINKKEKIFLFIDEIQNLPIITRVAKYLYDHYQVKFFMTGSSSFYLKNLFSESMAGRKLIFEIFPLTFEEFLVFKEIKRVEVRGFTAKALEKSEVRSAIYKNAYEEYLEYGGFPKVVLEPDKRIKKEILTEVFNSYFEKDVKTLSDFSDRSRLRDLILLLVPRTASRIEIEKLSHEVGVSRETVYNYLAFLEQTYFITMLPRYSQSIDRSVAGRRKLFFADTGLAGILGKASSGQLLENAVFQTLRPDHKLVFWQHESQEIDFIVDGETSLEVKMTASRRDLLTLKQRSAPLKLKNNYLVSLNWSPEKEVIMASDL